MGALEELGLMEADLTALALDRPDERRAPDPRPAPSMGEFGEAVERGKGRFQRDRRRRERDGLAEARAMHLVESVDAGEAIGEVAERLGISIETAYYGYSFASSHPNSPLPRQVCAVLGRRKEGGERAAMVESLGGEDQFEELAEELAAGLREVA